MKADTRELKQVLTPPTQYVIPAFQRDYEWTEDGQQRLTTLMLLTRGVLDALIERDSDLVDQVRRLLWNPADLAKQSHEKYKLWPRRKDRDVWRTVMDDAAVPTGDHLYEQARRFFAEQAREAMTGEDGTDRSAALVHTLIGLFKLVVIDLEDNDDAKVIFEVLNGRQTPLSASDLVKNLLFLRREFAEDTDVDVLYDTYWAEFDDPWWGTPTRVRQRYVLRTAHRTRIPVAASHT